jgi:hypothetical protein
MRIVFPQRRVMMKLQDRGQLVLQQGFVLLEPSNRPHYIDDKCLACIPCVPLGLGKIEHLMPQLIDLTTISKSEGELLEDLCVAELEHARPPYVCAWISSELNGDDLAALVAERLVGSDRGRRLIWRFYDPRVTSLAYNVLVPEQRDALFHDIQCWVLPWAGHWWCIEGPRDQSSAYGIANQSWPTSDQWTTFSISDLIHRIHAEICARMSTEPKAVPAIQQALIRGMREASTNLRLVEPAQQAEYARLLVLFGDAFKYHGLLEGMREKLANGHMQWSEFRTSVDEDELDRLTPEFKIPCPKVLHG